MLKKELEEREIKLEAIIEAYQQLITKFANEFPISLGPIQQLEQYSIALYNTAEVREGIEDLVDFSIVYANKEE